MGIDPATHRPKVDAGGSPASSSLSHMAQWESARLEAEARLVRESKLQLGPESLLPSAQPARLVLNRISARQCGLPCLDVLKAWKNSWSLPAAQDKNTRMHNMYALMLAADDGDLESPTSTLSFPEPMLPPSSTNTNTNTTTVGILPSEKLTISPAATTTTTVSSLAAPTSGIDPWGCWAEEENREIIGERTNLQDDDIMVAVEAFMGERYKNVQLNLQEVLSSNSITEGLNREDHHEDVLIFESNENMNTLGFVDINGEEGSMIIGGGNTNFEDKNHYWNNICSTQTW